MPTRDRPLAQVNLYDVGHGDPLVLDKGFAAYDILDERCYRQGKKTPDSLGRPLCWIEPGLGLTQRPYVVFQDTRLSQWQLSPSGSWAEVRPVGGGQRTYHLFQFDAGLTSEYSATSNLAIPANPHVAFSFVLPETPGSWDFVGSTPYLRVELAGTLGVLIQRQGPAVLQGWNGSYWEDIVELGTPRKGGGLADDDQVWVYVRFAEGKIGISFDNHEYKWLEGFSVPAGKVVIRGRGGQCIFGMHQIRYYDTTFTAQGRRTFVNRFGSLIITARGWTPSGLTPPTFTDASSLADQQARWRVTLTALATPAFPFTFYQAPVVGAVQYRYPFSSALGGTNKVALTKVVAVDIDLPEDLGSSQATVTYLTTGTAALTPDHRDRKVEIRLGYKLSDGTEEWYTSFTGYISRYSTSWSDRWGAVECTFNLDNVSAKLKTEWGLLLQVQLGNNWLNDSADFILASVGLDVGYRTWSTWGGSNVLPLEAGPPDEPFELTQPQESRWETLQRLFSYYDMEVAPTFTGGLISLPRNYADPAVSWNWYAGQKRTDPRENTDSISQQADYTGRATEVQVYAEPTEFSDGFMAYAVDGISTGVVGSGVFTTMLRVKTFPAREGAGPYAVMGQQQQLAGELFGVSYDVTLTCPVHLGLGRKQRVALWGYQRMGIPDGQQHSIESLRHSFREGQALTDLKTTVGLRRMFNV